MPLPRGKSVIAALAKGLGHQRLVRAETLQIAVAVYARAHRGAKGMRSGVQGRPRRHANGAAHSTEHIIAAKVRARPNEAIQMRRAHARVAAGRDRVVAVIVGHDKEHVGPIRG